MIPVTVSEFGVTQAGDPVQLYTLLNKNGVMAEVITFGATLVKVITPDSAGRKADIVLGFDKLIDYETRSPFFGATTGRAANRIANGTFDLEGRPTSLRSTMAPTPCTAEDRL